MLRNLRNFVRPRTVKLHLLGAFKTRSKSSLLNPKLNIVSICNIVKLAQTFAMSANRWANKRQPKDHHLVPINNVEGVEARHYFTILSDSESENGDMQHVKQLYQYVSELDLSDPEYPNEEESIWLEMQRVADELYVEYQRTKFISEAMMKSVMHKNRFFF